jgi:lactoylglutathione lyase
MDKDNGFEPELRVVLTVTDFENALRFFRDALGLVETENYSTETSRAVVLDAGRATIELADASHAASVDEAEVGRRVAGPIRFAFAVPDAPAVTQALTVRGATVVAEATVTPWGSLNARLDGPDGIQLTLFGPVPD